MADNDESPLLPLSVGWFQENEKTSIAAVYQSKSACFSDLVRLSGLNPGVDFRFADLTGVDFRGADLRGYNFFGANLSYTSWETAVWDATTNLEGALLTGARGYQTLPMLGPVRGLGDDQVQSDGRTESESSVGRVGLERVFGNTLGQLSSGIAIFDGQCRLAYYNESYRQMWGLDRLFLDSLPYDSSVLDRLYAAHKIPAGPDFQAWKAGLHEAYSAAVSAKHVWHLPDGRVLSVVTTPNPGGGVTYVFDDITGRVNSARGYDELIEVQREALDSLTEAFAVFDNNGRVRLFNPAFARMWNLAPEALQERPHIDLIQEWCLPLFDDNIVWQTLRGVISGIDDSRYVLLKLDRNDRSVLQCRGMRLPEGGTILTFQDITDTENVERVLRERNEALEAADRIKIDFVHHVSYELRSPLTTILGFANFLSDSSTGPLTDKQAEYVNYITTSTNALMAIINNILDLASIDAGAMTLNLGPIDIRKAIDAAAEGIQDRLARDQIGLQIDIDPAIDSFIGDERRVVQVLYNLLANAVNFSPVQATVRLAVRRCGAHVEFTVTDSGPGIAPALKEKMFDLFAHDPQGRHRGAGLGLSLVRSVVELHGGRLSVSSGVGQGTSVCCSFPIGELAISRDVHRSKSAKG